MTDGQTNRQADKFEQIHFKKDNILITRKNITTQSVASPRLHKLISIYLHCDLDLWPLTSKINRVHPLIMVNMSAKFDKEICNGLVSIVFTRSTHGRTEPRTHGRTEPQQRYYIPTATRCAGIIINYYTPFIEWEFSVSVDTMSHPSFVMGFLISYRPRPRFVTLELILVIDSTIPYLWIDHHFRESHAGQPHHEEDEEVEAAHNGQWSLDLLPSHRGTSDHQLVGTEQALTGKEQHSGPQSLKYQGISVPVKGSVYM